MLQLIGRTGTQSTKGWEKCARCTCAICVRVDGNGQWTDKDVWVEAEDRYDGRIQDVFNDLICSEVER